MDLGVKKRYTMKLKHPNPLFEEWLTEWRDKAIESDSKMQHCFRKALESLRKYPLQLDTGKDCIILQGFGAKLCRMLDDKLKKFKIENPDWTAEVTTGLQANNLRRKTSNTSLSTTPKKEYIPTWRSGAFAILIALHKRSLQKDYPGFLYKVDVIKHGQRFCDKSFVKPDPGSYYTAWSSMKILLEKQLVVKKSCPAKFSLTDQGRALASKVYQNYLKEDEDDAVEEILNQSNINVKSSTNTKNINTAKENKEKDAKDETKNETCPVTTDETFIFTSFSFDIILLVDKQETSGSKDPLDDTTLAEFSRHNVRYELRHLKVGDYTWICRHRETNKELVLPYIVERKRMDDFGASIKDGRFHEQKFRLKQCGIQNVTYLIESYGNNTYTGLPLTTLYQAATNTLIHDGFDVKFTENLRETINYFEVFTTILQNTYEKKTLVSCPKQNLSKVSIYDEIVSLMTFDEFNKGASKTRNFKVKDLFVRQLLQLKGMSVDKALAIVDKYPTPLALRLAYNEQQIAKEKMLCNLQFGDFQKKIGPAISNTIYRLYTSTNFQFN